MGGPKLSIVVIAFRQREALVECLEACQAAGALVAGGAELIVVDNGRLAPMVREHFPCVRLIEPGFNAGFAGGANLGIAAAAGQWIVLVNDDARIEPDALMELVEAAARSDRIGSVAAQVRFAADRGRLNSAGITVDGLGIATERLAGAPIGAADHPADVFGATACCALFRRAMLEQIGGFDERFFAYLEDVDVAWRAQAAGWSCVYAPSAVAYHRGSASSGHASAKKYYLVGRNRMWLLARNATTPQLLRALPGILLYDSAYIAYVLVTEHTLAPLRGRLAGIWSFRAQRRDCRAGRRPVELGRRSWRAAFSQHVAYRELAASDRRE